MRRYTGGRAYAGAREARGGGKFCEEVGGGEKQVYILYISPIHT